MPLAYPDSQLLRLLVQLMQQQAPKVSVLMSVFKEDQATLRWSLQSLIDQTYRNFEVIIVDDCAPINIEPIVAELNDNRLRLVRNESNLGLTKSLIKAANLARGEYLARLDADDACRPDRLDLQVKFLEDNPSYVLCGSRYRTILNNVLIAQTTAFIETDSEIRRRLSQLNPFCHSSVVFRSAAYHACGGYDPGQRYAQDYDLWVRLLSLGNGHNLKDELVMRTFDRGSISFAKRRQQLWHSIRTRVKAGFRYGWTLTAVLSLIKSLISLFIPNSLMVLKMKPNR